MSTSMALAPSNLTELMAFADRAAKSDFVPTAYKGKPENVALAIQMGSEVGLAPIQALQNIAVINGKPSIYGDAALALVKASSVCQDVQEKEMGSAAQGDAHGYECIAIRKGKAPVRHAFTVGDAKKAGLWGKQGPWSSYPKRMLQMRARGFALRDAFPDVLKGLITAEEAGDIPEKELNPLAPGSATPPKPAPTAPRVTAQQPAPGAATIDGATGEVLPAGSATQSSAPQPPTPPDQQPEIEPGDSSQNAWPLFAPGQAAPLSSHADAEAWLVAYRTLETSIVGSKKLKKATKQQKLRSLKEANDQLVIDRGDAGFLDDWTQGCTAMLETVEQQTEAA